MQAVNELLEDDVILDVVYEAQGRRHSHSRTRGRSQTPSEVVLRMLILKARPQLELPDAGAESARQRGFRCFCGIGMEKVPGAKTLVRLGQTVGPQAICDRLMAMAQERTAVDVAPRSTDPPWHAGWRSEPVGMHYEGKRRRR